MQDWWTDLNNLERIFWLVAIPASVTMIIQLVLTLMGGDIDDMDGDISTDAEVDADHGIGFQFFTFKNLVAFFTIFGWTGIACLKSEMSDGTSIAVAVIAGLTMMMIMATIFYYSGKLVEDGSLVLRNAIGAEGEVYLTIPASKGGMGKIQIKIQGALRELDAITEDPEDLKTGSIVRVARVSPNNVLTVTKS